MRGSHRLYARASRRVMTVLRAVGGPFEQASIDEAYLDVTEATGADWDKALALCEGLQREIVDATGLTASFGLGPTRLLAKMSSEERKPQGLFRLMPGDASAFFEGRSLREIPGIGPATATTMQEWGVQTVDEAYGLGELALARMVGPRFAAWLMAVVEERTSDDVSVLRSRKSIGKETTFERDQHDEEQVLEHLLTLVERVMDAPLNWASLGVWARSNCATRALTRARIDARYLWPWTTLRCSRASPRGCLPPASSANAPSVWSASASGIWRTLQRAR